MAIIFDGDNLRHNNRALLEEGTPMALINMKVHVLSNGDTFNIKKRRTTILPIEASFI